MIERSHELPVVVDFWAAWCGPCRMLGPAIEAEVTRREGELELAKIDVDAEQTLAAQYGIQSIPWGAETRSSCRGRDVVLVDEPAEEVASVHLKLL